MLCTCRCNEESKISLLHLFEMTDHTMLDTVEVEFKELPYFLVSRSRAAWNPEKQGNINDVELIAVIDEGLLVAPEGTDEPGFRRTLIPWTNVISLSSTRTTKGSD